MSELRVLFPLQFYQQETFLLWLWTKRNNSFYKDSYLSKNTRTYSMHSLYRISHASFKYVIYLGSAYKKKYISRKKDWIPTQQQQRLNYPTTTMKTNAVFCKICQIPFKSKFFTTFLQNMIPLLLRLYAVVNVLVKATVFDQSVNDISDSLNNQRKIWSLNILPCL